MFKLSKSYRNPDKVERSCKAYDGTYEALVIPVLNTESACCEFHPTFSPSVKGKGRSEGGGGRWELRQGWGEEA